MTSPGSMKDSFALYMFSNAIMVKGPYTDDKKLEIVILFLNMPKISELYVNVYFEGGMRQLISHTNSMKIE